MYLAIGAAAIAVIALLPAGRPEDVLYSLVSASAAAAVFAGIRLHAPQPRWGWLTFGAGLALWTAGDIVWTAYTWIGGEAPFPSPADPLYLAGYPAAAAGLFALVRRTRASRATIVDAVVMTASTAAIVWLAVVHPLAASAGPGVASAVALAYPIGSVVLVAATLTMVLACGTDVPSLRLLVAGLAAWLTADAVYAHQGVNGTYVSGSLVDYGWLVGYVLMGAAVLHPSVADLADGRDPDRVSGLSPRRFLLLALATAATPSADALIGLEPDWLVDLTTVGSFLLVAARLAPAVDSLARHALRDSLTGLPNRALLVDRIALALDGLSRSGGSAAVLFCDLDNFKVVNDSLGHPAGDELLVAVADRLTAVVGTAGTVARLGGDEFVVLLPHVVDDRAVDRLAAGIVESIARPVRLAAGATVHPTVSIGVCTTDDPSVSPEALLRDADAAMYGAKAKGRARAERFEPQLRRDALTRLHLDAELRDALRDGALFCVFQPELDLQTGALFGLEALVRWRHPRDGVLGPDRFVPHAEATGLIGDVFSTVLDATLAAQARWLRATGTRPSVAVNVSPRQLGDPALARAVLEALARHDAPPESLFLEITESGLADHNVHTLTDLRVAGVNLAVDDFGTGWSSLARLAAHPWDVVKIDRSFVTRLEDDDHTRQLVAATVAMAHSLGMLTVAEGVETEAQAIVLREVGCDIAQGYLVGRPQPEDAITGLLEGWDAHAARVHEMIRGCWGAPRAPARSRTTASQSTSSA